jgi:hypothetical protein
MTELNSSHDKNIESLTHSREIFALIRYSPTLSLPVMVAAPSYPCPTEQSLLYQNSAQHINLLFCRPNLCHSSLWSIKTDKIVTQDWHIELVGNAGNVTHAVKHTIELLIVQSLISLQSHIPGTYVVIKTGNCRTFVAQCIIFSLSLQQYHQQSLFSFL